MRERIKIILKFLKITQKEFAEVVGMTAGGFTDYLKGRSQDLSSKTVKNIVTNFGVNPLWLLTGDGDMFLPGKDPRAGHHQELSPQHISSEPQAPDLHAEYTQRMQVIDGSVQEYPDIMSIEQIYRTRWYKKLPGEAQFVINALDELHDPEVLKALERICNNAVVRQRADEQLFADLEFLKQKAMGKLYKKGEAG